MADIALTFDATAARADWTIAGGLLATGGDLQTAVLISLFTDKLLPSDLEPTDGSTDRRGWWGDTYRDGQIGSLLWTLERAVKSNAASLLASAQKICLDALQWLVDDGVAATVTVQTEWIDATALGIVITITEPSGLTSSFRYAWAWGPLGTAPDAPSPGSESYGVLFIPLGSSGLITAEGYTFMVRG